MKATLEIPTEDAVWIRDELYCKTPEGLQITLDTLRGLGYSLYDLRDPKGPYSSIRDGVNTAEDLERRGRPLWFASLENNRFGKCNDCHSYISMFGIHAHGHTCEVCGSVTYLEMQEGSLIKFRFKDDGRAWLDPDVQMKVKRWDVEEGYLYLELAGREDLTPYVFTTEETEAYLGKHTDKWEAVEENGASLVKVRHQLRLPLPDFDPESDLDVKDTWGHRINYRTVRLWEGKEYGEYDFDGVHFPVPDTIHLYEAWHWAPLEPSPTLNFRVIEAGGQVSNLRYFTDDRYHAWRREVFKPMGVFIRHFTTLDADAWDRESLSFRLDPYGAIIDVATFCDPDSIIMNRPTNMGSISNERALEYGFGISLEEAEEIAAENHDRKLREFARTIAHNYPVFRRDLHEL